MADKNGLEKMVGKKNILDSSETLEAYSSDLSFAPKVRPRCVVKPGNAQEVQEIVKWANETGTPLVPVSSGPPHFRGDTIPRMGGSVIVDLSHMKKIVRIDTRNRVAMVEPGVTFSELQPELEKVGLSAYMPLCPRGSKSVVGSILEREPITMPAHHWDSTDPFLCAELIYGTGDAMRTGEAAGPETTEEQWKLGKSQMTLRAFPDGREQNNIRGSGDHRHRYLGNVEMPHGIQVQPDTHDSFREHYASFRSELPGFEDQAVRSLLYTERFEPRSFACPRH